MRNHEITVRQKLLKDGNIAEPGWARGEMWEYRRGEIRAPGFRIKEWDYYLIMGDDFGIAMTVSDDGYIGLQSVSLLKLGDHPWEHTETVLNAFPMGKLKLPESADAGVTEYADRRLQMRFEPTKGFRHLTCHFDSFCDGKPFDCDVTLYQPEMDSMVIATPWPVNHRFYYNRKINCMRASGKATFDGETFLFDPEKHFGTLDWGRGVWTYDNTWYWGSGNGIVDGHDFGFNVGYGFGNTAAATENILFCDGKAHKLEDVTFHIPDSGYTDPWRMTSSDGRFEMRFDPILDRAAKINAKVIVSDQHQVFGRLNGKAVLDDGTALEIRDLLCFFEKVHNKY